MKFAILGDTHFGARGNSERFHRFFDQFFTQQFFPYIKEHNIRTVFQLGDLFDIRKTISTYTLAESFRYFFKPFLDSGNYNPGVKLHALIGNHDIYYRESLSVNTPSLVIPTDSYNVELYSKPETVSIDGTTIDMIPWICKENYDEVMEFISKSKSDICMGHFEIAGFAMYRGMEAKSGLTASMFDKYELVLSGHYHTRSQKENITYVGTPYEITWQDCNDLRGFHVFDTDTRKLEFIPNRFTLHEKIFYRDTMDEPNYFDLADKYVRIIVESKNDLAAFDKFVKKVQEVNPFDLSIVDDLSEFKNSDIDGDEINIQDTLSIIDKYVDSVDTDKDKEKVKSYMRGLYVEAINMEVV